MEGNQKSQFPQSPLKKATVRAQNIVELFQKQKLKSKLPSESTPNIHQVLYKKNSILSNFFFFFFEDLRRTKRISKFNGISDTET